MTPLAFPSIEWFEALGKLMEEHRVRHEHVGTIDCVAQFTVFHPADEAKHRHFQVTFELYSATGVAEVSEGQSSHADFVMATDLDVWAEMIDNIAEHGGKPDLEHSLNRLSLPGVPMRVWADDPLGRDMFFRFNQSLQEYVNASAQLETVYPDLD
ncbi:MAG: hypothetical protein ACRDY7_16000 [Acidimicrobiia bacterium]